MATVSTPSTPIVPIQKEDAYVRFQGAVDMFLGNLVKSYPGLEKKLKDFVEYYHKALAMNPFVLFLMAKGFIAGFGVLNSVESVRKAIMENDPAVRNLFGLSASSDGEFPFHIVWAQSDAENKKIILSSMVVLNRRAEALMKSMPADLNLEELSAMVQNIGVIDLKAVSVNTEESVEQLGLEKKDADTAKLVMGDIVNSVKGGSYDIMGAVEKICSRVNSGEVDGNSLYTIIGTLMSKISAREEEEDSEEEVEDEDVD
jgi:hypothetical protein